MRMTNGQHDTGRVALITGSTAGFGRAVAQYLASLGMVVAINGRDEARGTTLVNDLRASGASACWVPFDVQDAAAVMRGVAHLVEQYGRLDVVIPCASLYEAGCVTDVTPEQWQAVLGTTLTGTFHTLQAAWPHLQKTGGARVITVGCVGAERVYHGTHTVPYRIAVNGLYALTKAYAQLGAPCGVTVNMLALGFLEQGQSDIPLDRLPAGRPSTPDDILPTVRFLLSAAAAHVNGACINVAGGYVT